MGNLLEYKCPSCGGALNFDSSIQKMKCPYCDTEFKLETLKKYDDELNDEKSDDINWNIQNTNYLSAKEDNELNTYICQSCGGEIVGDKTTASTKCPFCDTPVIITQKFSGNLRPDYIIPFKLDKQAAKDGLKKHLKKKFFLPKVFKSENHIDEIKGVYVPFWLFGAHADGQARYRATRTSVWSDSNYNYTQTSFYSVVRVGNLDFENIPVNGCSKISNDLMESLEPFNHKDAVDFQTAYLAGYISNKYDITASESVTRANERVKHTVEDALKSTVTGFNTILTQSSSVNLNGGSIKYALYPVWLLNTTWNNKKYTFAMNGQTGQFVGNLPMDKKAYLKWFAAIAGISSIITYGLAWLINLMQ